MDRSRPRRDWLAIWILWSAWCSISGWLLSAISQLDRPGYAVMVLLFGGGMILTRHYWTTAGARPLFLFRRATYRRLLPKAWVVLVALSLAGGLWYRGDNYDYLTYRFPRLIHWWWAHHWYWIETTNLRMNFSATGFEWLMAPIFVFFQSDRPFFLINLVSYVMLPGLIFSVFRGLGVRGRTAWWWMWVLPAGLCYALEAGGLGNDMFSGVYLLAAFHYGWKARDGSIPAIVLSVLSIALVTNGKASNLPLAAPWLALLLFPGRIFPGNPRAWAALLGVVPAALLISVLPTMVANYHFTGDYAGDPTDWEQMKVHNPLFGLIGTTLMIVVANLSPPILPHEIRWNLLPGGLADELAQAFPRFNASSPALVLEESCSLGIGVSFLLILAILYGLRTAAAGSKTVPPAGTKWVAVGLALAWVALMAKLASEGVPRIVAPYYLLTVGVALALLPFDGLATRRPLWRALAYFAMLTAIAVVVVTPGRPLFPYGLAESAAKVTRVSQVVMESWKKNQGLRVPRYDLFRSLRCAIPSTEKKIGLVCNDDIPGVSLWLPFGSREVVELDPAREAPGQAGLRGIRYVAVSDDFLVNKKHLSLADLTRKWSATVVQSERIPMKSNQTETWSLLQLP